MVLSSLLVLSIGLGGGTAIYQSARSMRRELTTEYQLFAENRAFALRDNFEILEDELARLSAQPPTAPVGDQGEATPEDLLAGERNSTLYNTAVLLLSADGTCLRSVPERAGYRGQHFGDRAWFKAARDLPARPLFRTADEPGLGRTLKIVQPLRRGGRFAGALVGVIAFAEDNVIAPSLHDNLPRETDAVLVDETGEVIYPTDRARAAEGSDWSRAIELAASGGSGTMTGQAHGQEALFAYSPVKGGTRFAVVFSWPWRTLTANLKQQAFTLGGFLLFGLLLAGLASIALSAYLARPLQVLGEGATRIARGEHVPALQMPRAAGTEEVAALVAAFEHMETSIQKRDQELRDAAALLEQRVADRTRELTAAQQALVEAERFAAMGKTSAAIAHELKNTLNGLGMAVELIVQEPTNTARVARLHPQVAHEIARLRDVVDSLLSFSRVPRIERARADLAVVVSAAGELLADLVGERGGDLSIDAPASLSAVCDAHKIQGVIVNLVKNAVEAGRTVRVRAYAAGSDAVIEVEDDGPGLSPDAREHLFEPFFTTKPNGTGLGLPTSRRYVEAHGGTLEGGTSVALGGERFRVVLPRDLDGRAAGERDRDVGEWRADAADRTRPA
ncbi:MAG TPA: sensor histidine kinase [Polyangia bacterium]|nr:sensor histidine kinase [Polyangia bacterium]